MTRARNFLIIKENEERDADMARQKRADGKNAHAVASHKYDARAYDRVTILLKKGEKDILQYYCELNDISMNKLIIDCINWCSDLNLK